MSTASELLSVRHCELWQTEIMTWWPFAETPYEEQRTNDSVDYDDDGDDDLWRPSTRWCAFAKLNDLRDASSFFFYRVSWMITITRIASLDIL